MKKQGKFYDTILSKIKTVDYDKSSTFKTWINSESHVEDISQHVFEDSAKEF